MLREMCVGLALSISALPVAASAAVVNNAFPNEVPLSVSDVFIPSGFDSGADVFVVVNGYFPNSCYSWKNAQVNHISPTEHEIYSMGMVKPGMCLTVLLPYTQEVRLGRFESGVHTLRFMNGDGTYLERSMSVE